MGWRHLVIYTNDDTAAREMFNGGVMRMRLPDGTEGEFLVIGGSADRPVRISGSGAPPF